MAYGTPTNPVAGTVITVAYAIANMLDPIRWLRLLTGNADPPGTNYVVVSTSTTGTSWQKVPADALAAGVAVANLGYTPANRNGDTFQNPVMLTRTIDGLPTNGLLYFGNSGSVYLNYDGAALNVVGTPAIFTGDVVQFLSATPTVGRIILGNGSHIVAWDGTKFTLDGNTAWHSGNDGAASTLDAGLLAGLLAGNASGNVPISNGTLCTNLNADAVRSKVPTATPTANQIPVADGAGKLDAWVTGFTPGDYVPSGLVAMFRTAAAIASGWTRETNLDGRIPVGAGTTFGATFTEANPYGSSWSITPSGTVAVVIASHAAVRRNANIAFGGGTDNVEDDHSHGITSATFTGSGASTWASMALRAYVYAIKT